MPVTATAEELRFTECDLVLDGQRLSVEPGRYDWAYLVLTRDGDSRRAPVIDEIVWLDYHGGLDPEHLRTVREADEFGPGATLARVGVPRRDELLAMVLPHRPGLRLIAIGLATANAHQYGGSR
jgi:hypothetical protein